MEKLRRQHNAIALNVIVDNDLCSTPSIRVPTGSATAARSSTVEFDTGRCGVLPFEERQLESMELFSSFADRVSSQVGPLVPKPMIVDHWREAVNATSDTLNVGRLLARFRHVTEIGWGSRTLELPLSQISDTKVFRQFLLHMLRQRHELQVAYNESLVDYRRINRIRSRAHPVPALSQHDAWQELPFWIWTKDRPARQPLFATKRGNSIWLTDLRREWSFDDSSTEIALQGLSELSDRESLRIRPRALMTTMFCRLLLADLFLHGIGGAKYDELTDEIARRFFKLKMPQYMTLTATLHLPVVGAVNPVEASIGETKQTLRNMVHHPERFVFQSKTVGNQVSMLLQAKQQMLLNPPQEGEGHAWNKQIRALNNELQPFIQAKRKEFEQTLELILNQDRNTAVLRSREFSFCLFPQTHLLATIFSHFAGGP